MKKNIILSVIIILVFAGAMFLLSNKKDKVNVSSGSQDWVIVPEASIGKLVKVSLNKNKIVDQIKSIFGAENVGVGFRAGIFPKESHSNLWKNPSVWSLLDKKIKSTQKINN